MHKILCLQEMSKLEAASREDRHEIHSSQKDLKWLVHWVLHHPLQLNEQEIQDVNTELDRLTLLRQLEEIEKHLPVQHENRKQVMFQTGS